MGRHNPAHARLFAGATPAVARTAPLRRSFVVELVRFADDRARFLLDQAARLELHPVIGDVLELELSWRDGDLTAVAVDVYAVHPGGFVDVRGTSVVVGIDQKPERCRLRRYPQTKRLP